MAEPRSTDWLVGVASAEHVGGVPAATGIVLALTTAVEEPFRQSAEPSSLTAPSRYMPAGSRQAGTGTRSTGS